MSRITRFILTFAIIALISFVDMFAATAPSRQAKYITFSNITANSVDMTFLKGNGAGRVIVISDNDLTVETPVDLTDYFDADGNYTHGSIQTITNGDKVIDVLTGNEWYTSLSNLEAGHTYTIKVYEYNDDGQSNNTAFQTSDGTANNPRSFSTPIVVDPPTALAANNVTATTADLSWTDGNSSPVSDGYIFTLYVDSQGEGNGNSTYDPTTESTVFPYVELDLGDPTDFELSDLLGPSDYKYELKAYIGTTESVPTSLEFFTPDDITEPQLVSITMSGGTGTDGVVYEEDNGNDLTFVVTFNEKMKTWLTPSFTFENPTPLDLSYVTGSWDDDGMVFTATVNFAGTTPQENLLIDVTIGNAEDLAGNSLDLAFDTEADLFNIDNTDGVLSGFEYTTAGGFVDQSHCKSGENEDLIQFEIDLVELGYGSAGINHTNFNVVAEDQNNDNQIGFTSSDAGNGTYLFTAQVFSGQFEDDYNLIISFTDNAGNYIEDLSNTQLFRIDNVAPTISNVNFTNTCVNGDDVVTLTFDASDVDGCGTFDDGNISVDNNSEFSNDWSFVSQDGTLFTYTFDVEAGDADGPVDVLITAVDSAGNESTDDTNGAFTIDNTAPEISNYTVTSSSCLDNEETFTFTIDVVEDGCGLFSSDNITVDNDGTLVLSYVKTDSTGAGTSGDPFVYTYDAITTGTSSADDGDYEIDFFAYDEAGNTTAYNPVSSPDFSLDNTGPTLSNFTMVNLPTCYNEDDDVVFTYDGYDDGCATFAVGNISVTSGLDANPGTTIITGGTGVSGDPYHFQTTIDISALNDADGSYGITVNATDGNGNTSNSIDPVGTEFTIDNTAPVFSEITVTSSDCLNGDSDLEFTFEVVEEGCGTFVPGNLTVTTGLTDATPSIGLVGSGTSGSPYVFTYTYDVSSFTAEDADGSYDITINGTDDAGNPGTQLQSIGAFNVDNTDPIVAINEPDGSGSNNGSKVIDFTVTETGCGTPFTEASFDNSTWTTVTSATSTLANVTGFNSQTEPQFTLYMRTIDGAGNVSSTVSVTDSLDITKPTVSGVTPSDQEISIADNGNPFTITIEFDELMDNSGDNDPIVTITANNTLPTTNTGGSWPNLSTFVAEFGNIDVSTAEAIEDLDVTVSGARDNTEDDGNLMDEQTLEDIFSIDTEAPTVSFDGTSPAADDCVNGAEAIDFTADDVSEFSGFEFVYAKINFDDIYEVVDSGFYLEDLQAWDTLSQGTFTLYLLASDNFGNTTVITRDLNKDDVDPVISNVVVVPSCYKEGEEISITFDVDEGGCGTFDENDVELFADNDSEGPQSILEFTITEDVDSPSGSLHSFTATYTIGEGDDEGPYLIEIIATDDAGNEDIYNGEDDFSIDNTGPTLSNLVVNPSSAGGTTTSVDISFDAEEFGCSELDATSVVYTFTGPGTLDGESTLADPTFSGGTWTTTLSIASTDATGNYHISISAADGLGNLSNTLDPAGVELVIDNTPPQVFNVTTILTPPNKLLNRADDDGTPPEFFITVQYNEPLDTTIVPSITFHIPGKNPLISDALSPVDTAVIGNNSFRFTYELDKNSDIDMRQIGVRFNGAQDVAGNVQTTAGTQSNLFSIDFLTPQVNDLTVEVPVSGVVTDNTPQLELLWEFTEDMNISTTPTITFPGADPNITNVLTLDASSAWELNKYYRAIFNVNPGFGLDIDNISVGFVNATDLAGNPTPSSTSINVFSIDTEEPACSSIATTPATPEVILSDLDFEVEVILDQALDPSVYPVITFASSTSFSIDSSTGSGYGFSTSTNPNDRFTFKVTHNGTTEENIDDELITVGGFSDLPGNIQTVACSTTVDIDTDRPDITSITVSDDKICVSDDEASEVITITFDEAMDDGVNPVITFDADIVGNGILHSPSGGWSSGNTVYTATYTIETENEFTLSDVDIIVNSAQDVLGNVMLEDNTTGANTIDVDTELPSVSNIAFNPLPSNAFGVNRSNIGAGGFEVVITYDEEMDAGTTPSIAFNPPQGGTGTVGQALTIGSGSWNSPTNTIFTQLYTVNDANVELDGVDATITNGEDLCGNVQNSSNPEPSFAIDLIAPTCVSLVAETDPIYEGDWTQSLTVTFSEPMSNTVNPTFAFAESENFTTFTGGAGWVSNVFTINANHNGTEEEIPIEIVSLDLVSTQPIDLAGNPVESASCTDQFEIDTRKPLVSSVEFDPTKVIGTTTEFSVTVTFDEQMNILVTPTIVFSAGSTTLTSDGGSWNVDTTVYTASYDVTDLDFEGTGITVDISLAEDVAGNVMLTHTSTETFNIDQVEPTVTSVTFSSHPGWINRSDIGNDNFTVTVVYDESMDDVTNPTISLDELNSDPTPSIDHALVFASGSWTTTINTNDTYIATYDVVDVAAADEQLGATISGGKDACGNVQVPYSTNSEGDGVIDIDLVNPTISFDSPTPLAESCVSGDETINFTADDVILLDKVQARIGTNAFADIDDGDAFNTLGNWGSTSDGPITIELKALDLAGNETVISRSFNKDVAAPVISDELFTNNCVTTADVINISFTVTDASGCGTIIADNLDATGFPAGNGELSEPTITGSGPYFVSATYTVGSTDAEGSYEITFTATDDAGNMSTSVNSNAFTIDKTQPNYTLLGGPSPTCTNNSNDVVSTFISNDDTFGCGTYGTSNITASTSLGTATITNIVSDLYQVTVDLSGTDNTDDGTYDIDIVMTDAAGNVRNETIEDAFTIDNTAPIFSNFQITGEEGSCLAGGRLLEFSVDVTEAGCGTFDEDDIEIEVNGSVTNNIVAQEENPSGSGTYYFELLIDNGDASGEYNLTFNGTDFAGNDATEYAPAGAEFKIDNTNPVIAITNPSDGATVNGSKAIAFTADDGTGCGIDYSEFSVDGSTWTGSGSVSTISDISGFGVLPEAGFTLTLRTFDLAGNSSTASVNLTKDVTGPSVSTAVASDDLLSIADGGSAFSVAITFNEGMDETFDPTVTLTANGTVASTNTGGSWNSPTNTIFTATFGNVNGGSDEEINDLDVTVSGAKDDTEDDGNTMTLQTINDVFSIDTKAPTCATLVTDTDPIFEGDLIQGTTVTFSEPMDKASLTSFNVDSFFDISFSTEFSSNNFTWDGPGGSFAVDLIHNGTEETIPVEIVALTLSSIQPTDLAGNPMQVVGCSDQFEIDTRKPLVDNVTFSTPLVTEATTTFSVAVEFDEAMGSTVPTLAFNGGVSSAFSSTGGSWVGDTYTFNYNVADQDFNLTGLTVDISGAKDVAGNTMAIHTSTETYAIDQVAPTITDASIASNNTIDNQYAGEGHVVSLTISPSEELDIAEFTGNIAGITIGSVTDNFGSTGEYVIPVTITSSESEGVVTFSIDYKDINGNPNSTSLTAVTDASSVTIDLTSPEGVIDEAVAQNDPTADSPINFTVVFDEDVYNVDGNDFALSGTAGATTATVTGSGTTYNVAVSGMTGSGTVILEIAGINNITDVVGNSASVTTDDNQVTYNVAGATIVESGPGSEPFTIQSTVDTQVEASLNFDFDVTDDGLSPGADNIATLITDIEITQGGGNDIGDWTDVIGGAVLTDGTNTVSASSINSTDIQFNGLAIGSGQIGEVQDEATKNYQLKVWLLSNPALDVDNLHLVFNVNRGSFSTNGSGSSFKGGDGTDVSSGANDNAIDVDATELAFVSSPASTEIDTDTEFEIEATDENGNLDSDYGPSTVTLTADQSTITSGGFGTMNSGTLTLSSVRFDSSAENDFVTASDGSLTNGVSDFFNIKEEEPLPIVNLNIIPSRTEFLITYSNRDTANTLVLAKFSNALFAYGDESGMDDKTDWPTPNTTFGTGTAHVGSGIYVIYSGQDSSVTMTGLTPGFKSYAVTAYSFRGALNSGVQNFNEIEASKKAITNYKQADYSDEILQGLRLGIDNITPQPASINGNVSLEIETVNEMPLSLELYDSKGEKVMVIFNNREFRIGETPFEFNINNTISSGQYFLRLSGNGEVVIAPLTIVN